MIDKNPKSPPRPGTQEQPAGGQIHLDHGISSLVAQDNPDDSQLGAPEQTVKQVNRSPK